MTTAIIIEPAMQARLRKRWWAYLCCCLAMLAGGFAFLYQAWTFQAACRWLGLASLGMTYILWQFWISATDNYRPGENRLLPDLGAGNILSLARGVLIASLVGFLFAPWPPGWLAWLPGIIYTVAAWMDFSDGIAARLSDHVTRLGETLDVNFDSLGTLVVTWLLSQYGQAPAWFVLLGLARYLFLAAIWLRRRLGQPVYDLPPSNSRRMIAGFTFGFTFALLWPILKPPGTAWAAAFWALPFLGGFLLDWLSATGILRPGYEQKFVPLTRFCTTWLPVLLRSSVLLLLGPAIFWRLTAFAPLPYLSPWLHFLETKLIWLDLLVMIMSVLGVAGRSFALAGMFTLGLHQLVFPLDLLQRFLIYIYIALVFLGSGSFSLWQPEDRLIERRVGEAKR